VVSTSGEVAPITSPRLTCRTTPSAAARSKSSTTPALFLSTCSIDAASGAPARRSRLRCQRDYSGCGCVDNGLTPIIPEQSQLTVSQKQALLRWPRTPIRPLEGVAPHRWPDRSRTCMSRQHHIPRRQQLIEICRPPEGRARPGGRNEGRLFLRSDGG